MSDIFKTYFSFVIAMLCFCGLSACTGDYDDETESEAAKTLMVFRVSPVSSSTRSSENIITEKIKSLRAIIVDEGKIGLDSMVYKDASDADKFETAFTYSTTPGTKKVYLIANEESVTGENNFPDGNVSLTEWLETIKKGDAASDFETLINNIYFAPQYNIENNSIYLPYTAYYEITVEKGRKEEDLVNMYLVPVATKFMFRFQNYRSNAVSVNGISMSATNQDNYLMAHIGSTDWNKSLNGTTYYWIDWLKKVSEESWKNLDFQDNVGFNTKYGWISDYDMPNATTQVRNFIASGSEEAGKAVPEREDENKPGTLSFGPYYCPESKHMKKIDENGTESASNEQNYYLTLSLTDEKKGTSPSFVNVPITNLQALFRNTYVIINVIMRENDTYEIYVDVDPWDEKDLNPSAGLDNKDGVIDNDPWDENESNPNAGLDNKDGVIDNDPWDESESNPNAGLDNKDGVIDNDPWDESELNPKFGLDDEAKTTRKKTKKNNK